MALIANGHRDPKRKPAPYKSADFHPYPRCEERPMGNASMELLKRVFVDRS